MNQTFRNTIFSLILIALLVIPLGVGAAQGLAPSAVVPVSGTIDNAVTWTSSNIYVLEGNLTVSDAGSLTIQAGTVIKAKPGFTFRVNGSLTLQGTSGSPVIFTSYRDDSVGGDLQPGDPAPAPGDWGGVLLYYAGAPDPVSFQYAQVRYANRGLHLQNVSGSPVAPPVANNRFENNLTGILLEAASGDIQSDVENNTIRLNNVGLQAQATSLGLVLFYLNSNVFEQNTTYPLLLLGSSFPDYSQNTFTANGYQGIGVADLIDLSSPWVKVPASPAPGAPILPYVVVDYLEIAQGTTLQIPAGLVVKFTQDALMEVYGALSLLGTAGEKVIFTSVHDDSYGGNTDGATIDPATAAWSGLELFYLAGSPMAAFAYTVFRYASNGLMITNGSNFGFSPEVHHNRFELNGLGVNILVGGNGNIASSIHDNQFDANQYGLLATAGDTISGVGLLTLQNNTFSNHNEYPIALQGSVFPSYLGNSFNSNTRTAIAVQGRLHYSGTWPLVPGPGSNLPYILTGNSTVNATYTLALPAGTVIKSGGPSMNGFGELDLQGTAQNPVVFTSLYDDTFGGNTDGNAPVKATLAAPVGTGLTPARLRLNLQVYEFPEQAAPQTVEALQTAPDFGDWAGVTLYQSQTVQHARFYYAVNGLRLYNNSSTPISFTISNNHFAHNQVGIDFLSPFNGGDITATVQDNQVYQNVTGVQLEWLSSYLGVSTPVLHNNNIAVNGTGVLNQQTGVTINAENNWWGETTGPYHPTLNVTGWGDVVSDRVDFIPWLGAPPLPPLAEYVRNFLPVMVRKY